MESPLGDPSIQDDNVFASQKGEQDSLAQSHGHGRSNSSVKAEWGGLGAIPAIPVLDLARFFPQKRDREQLQASGISHAASRLSKQRRSGPMVSIGMMACLTVIATMFRGHRPNNAAHPVRALRTVSAQHYNTTDHLELYWSRVWVPGSMVCHTFDSGLSTPNFAHSHFPLILAVALLLSVVMWELRGNPTWGAVTGGYLMYPSHLMQARKDLYEKHTPSKAFMISHASHLWIDLVKLFFVSACTPTGLTNFVITWILLESYGCFSMHEDGGSSDWLRLSAEAMLFAVAHTVVLLELTCSAVVWLGA
jgi:hypothetical protein